MVVVSPRRRRSDAARVVRGSRCLTHRPVPFRHFRYDPGKHVAGAQGDRQGWLFRHRAVHPRVRTERAAASAGDGVCGGGRVMLGALQRMASGSDHGAPVVLFVVPGRAQDRGAGSGGQPVELRAKIDGQAGRVPGANRRDAAVVLFPGAGDQLRAGAVVHQLQKLFRGNGGGFSGPSDDRGVLHRPAHRVHGVEQGAERGNRRGAARAGGRV